METENLPIPTYRQGSFPKQVEDQPSWYKISVTRDAFPKIILEIENYFHQRDGMKWNMLYTYGGYVCSPISGGKIELRPTAVCQPHVLSKDEKSMWETWRESAKQSNVGQPLQPTWYVLRECKPKKEIKVPLTYITTESHP
jgi:hypothetical protein